jgi:glucosylglycerol 3-phosphatase
MLTSYNQSCLKILRVPQNTAQLCTDHRLLARTVSESERLLIIQDLDGVCMGLVRDPRTRRLERRYLDAAAQLASEFFVLTNGEHDGDRGVNAIVEAAYGDPSKPQSEGCYLPGLAAGGVQLQDRHGAISHPGVSQREIRFLAQMPLRAAKMLAEILGHDRLSFLRSDLEQLVSACVLNNRVSPTLNLNPLHARLAGSPEQYLELQRAASEFLESELARAREEGLEDSFFIHLAPNQGRDNKGRERLRAAQGRDAGTTDFQLMLRGAVKEAGVIVLLNHYYREHYGVWPLGENFNAREAPADADALLELAADHFDPQRMPRIVGVGDTLTSDRSGSERHRGGSDRGFLELVQGLSEHFGTNNLTVFVDSSGGEVRRPGLRQPLVSAERPNWQALEGISDERDPLRINYLFPGGHRSYIEFFCDLAERRAARRKAPG